MHAWKPKGRALISIFSASNHSSFFLYFGMERKPNHNFSELSLLWQLNMVAAAGSERAFYSNFSEPG
jgi:hypothetical protein